MSCELSKKNPEETSLMNCFRKNLTISSHNNSNNIFCDTQKIKETTCFPFWFRQIFLDDTNLFRFEDESNFFWNKAVDTYCDEA